MIFILFSIALILISILFYMKSKADNLDRFPSPKGYLLVGNAFQIDNARPHHTMENWAKTFGSAFVFRAFGKRHLVINSPEALYECLVLRGDAYGGRPYWYRADLSFGGGKSVAFQTLTPQWRVLRKQVHKSVKQYGGGLKRLESITLASLKDMLDRMDERKGEEFDAQEELYETFTHIVCQLILGKKLARNDPMLPQVIAMEKKYCQGLTGAGDGMLLDMMPWLRHVGNSSYKTLCEAMTIREKLWGKYIPELKETLVKGQERGIADALLVAKDEIKDEYGNPILDDTCIEMALTDVINGGTVTTSSTLYAFLNIMLHHEDVQQKLQQEVDQFPLDDSITLLQRHDMPYTRATILELLRYTTIGSLGLPHETTCDTMLQGQPVPKGTYVIPNLWRAHHDEKVWDQPWTFMPERFLDEDGQLLPPDHKVQKYFMPFGAGTRVCVGEGLAKGRIFLAIVTLIRRFEVQPPLKGKLVSCDPRLYSFGGLLVPPRFTVRMVQRSQFSRN